MRMDIPKATWLDFDERDFISMGIKNQRIVMANPDDMFGNALTVYRQQASNQGPGLQIYR